MFPPIPNPTVAPAQAKFGDKDLVRRSASAVPAPAQKLTPVAKLIDVSKCIGCKACQSACLEWNDLREPVGFNDGTYNNPPDLTPASLTVMKFTEWVNPETKNLEWLIRKDGCMHCADPGCLKACPAPGAIVQYTNGIVDFVKENCIGCGYCVKGCPFNIPRISKADSKAYKCTLCSDRVAVGQGPAWWVSLAYLTAFGSVTAFLLYFRYAQRVGPARAAMTGVMIPPIALAVSAALEGWRPDALSLIGIALCVFAVAYLGLLGQGGRFS